MFVFEITVNAVAARVPKLTAVAPVKALPVMLTTVPPFVVPLLGLMLLTDGVEAADTT
jgi:hypothetical protein